MRRASVAIGSQRGTETSMSEAKHDYPAPKVLGGLIAYLQVDGAFKAAEFYKRAFGAEQVFAYPADEQGRTMHVHLYINGSSMMLADAYPEHGHPHEKAQGY